jgi:hypothetical protein
VRAARGGSKAAPLRRHAGGLIWLSLSMLACGFPIAAVAQSPQPPTVQAGVTGQLDSREAIAPSDDRQPDRQSSGYIHGTVIDQVGRVSVDTSVRLKRDDQSLIQEVLSGENGEFVFSDLSAGPFQLTITAYGFQTQRISGVLLPGQAYLVPEIRLAVATLVTEVRVAGELTQVEVAQDQIKEQEKQKVLGFIPNFFVSYVPDAAPLVSKQKFELAWKSSIDPFTFLGVAALAGVQQATGDFNGYGQGVEGYAKRFGAAYADVLTGTYIGSAILPSLLKQDPRYFYKGTGTPRSRLLYAVANTVICKGDNKRWQPNYSGIGGSFATGAISYLYYPASDRDVKNLVLQNSLIRIGETALANVLQEFVVRKFTPHLQSHPPVRR